MGFWTRIKTFGPWSREQRQRDLDREIRNHLELEAEEWFVGPPPFASFS
jgi:hypothetical protein